MKINFSGYYPPSTEQYEQLWKEALIVLDTNVLLNLYRLPTTARDELIGVLTLGIMRPSVKYIGRAALISIAALVGSIEVVNAETVTVKYLGLVDISSFRCEMITRTSDAKRLCYNSKEKILIVNLSGGYYQYCGVPGEVITAWLQADPMNDYYNTQVRKHFDCRSPTRHSTRTPQKRGAG